jgi:hypothetical protein
MYDIDTKPYEKTIQSGWVGIAFGGIITIICLIIFLVNIGNLSPIGIYMLCTFFICFAGVSICLGINEINKGTKKLKLIEHLNKDGKLLKNVPCHVEYREDPQTHLHDPVIIIECVLRDESEIVLQSDPEFLPFTNERRRKIDLVIDIDNPKLYFIGKNINRIGGNQEYDYYTERGFNYSKDNK